MSNSTTSQGHTNMGDRAKFARDFAHFDDAMFIGVEEVAKLLDMNVAAIYQMRQRGRLPTPAIHRHRLIRWTTGQIRQWCWALEAQVPNTTAKAKLGRPRASIASIEGEAVAR